MKYVLFLNIKHPLILKTPPVFMIWGGSISQKGLYPLAHTVEGEHAYKPNQFQALYLTSDLPPKKRRTRGEQGHLKRHGFTQKFGLAPLIPRSRKN